MKNIKFNKKSIKVGITTMLILTTISLIAHPTTNSLFLKNEPDIIAYSGVIKEVFKNNILEVNLNEDKTKNSFDSETRNIEKVYYDIIIKKDKENDAESKNLYTIEEIDNKCSLENNQESFTIEKEQENVTLVCNVPENKELSFKLNIIEKVFLSDGVYEQEFLYTMSDSIAFNYNAFYDKYFANLYDNFISDFEDFYYQKDESGNFIIDTNGNKVVKENISKYINTNKRYEYFEKYLTENKITGNNDETLKILQSVIASNTDNNVLGIYADCSSTNSRCIFKFNNNFLGYIKTHNELNTDNINLKNLYFSSTSNEDIENALNNMIKKYLFKDENVANDVIEYIKNQLGSNEYNLNNLSKVPGIVQIVDDIGLQINILALLDYEENYKNINNGLIRLSNGYTERNLIILITKSLEFYKNKFDVSSIIASSTDGEIYNKIHNNSDNDYYEIHIDSNKGPILAKALSNKNADGTYDGTRYIKLEVLNKNNDPITLISNHGYLTSSMDENNNVIYNLNLNAIYDSISLSGLSNHGATIKFTYKGKEYSEFSNIKVVDKDIINIIVTNNDGTSSTYIVNINKANDDKTPVDSVEQIIRNYIIKYALDYNIDLNNIESLSRIPGVNKTELSTWDDYLNEIKYTYLILNNNFIECANAYLNKIDTVIIKDIAINNDAPSNLLEKLKNEYGENSSLYQSIIDNFDSITTEDDSFGLHYALTHKDAPDNYEIYYNDITNEYLLLKTVRNNDTADTIIYSLGKFENNTIKIDYNNVFAFNELINDVLNTSETEIPVYLYINSTDKLNVFETYIKNVFENCYESEDKYISLTKEYIRANYEIIKAKLQITTD